MSASSSAVTSEVARPNGAALAFLYEHPLWFAPIFAELERRRVAFDKFFIPDHFYEVGPQQPAFKVLFNRKEIVNNRSRRDVKVGDDTRDVELVQGWNELFIKMGTNNKDFPWAFGAQVLRPDRKGPLEGVEIRATPP